MLDSLIEDWLWENENRAYPLNEGVGRTVGAFTLTDGVILDASLIGGGSFSLVSIVSDANNVTFTITGSLSFVVSKTAVFPYYSRLTTGQLLVIGSKAAQIPIGTYNFSTVTFVPSVCHDFSGLWLGVNSIAFPGHVAFTGDVRLTTGYQFDVGISGQVLNLAAGSIYGEPIVCQKFTSNPADCDSIISYINGVAPSAKTINMISGYGTVVYNDPDNSRIFVGLSFNPEDVCKTIPTPIW